MAIRNIVSRRKELATIFLEAGVEQLLQSALKRPQRAPEVEIKAALRDLGCDVQLKEQWTGKGASMTNWQPFLSVRQGGHPDGVAAALSFVSIDSVYGLFIEYEYRRCLCIRPFFFLNVFVLVVNLMLPLCAVWDNEGHHPLYTFFLKENKMPWL